MSSLILIFGLIWFVAAVSRDCLLREAALVALAATVAFAVVVTEMLSFLGALGPVQLGGAWAIAAIASAVALYSPLRTGIARMRHLGDGRLDRVEWIVAICLGAFALGTLASALL